MPEQRRQTLGSIPRGISGNDDRQLAALIGDEREQPAIKYPHPPVLEMLPQCPHVAGEDLVDQVVVGSLVLTEWAAQVSAGGEQRKRQVEVDMCIDPGHRELNPVDIRVGSALQQHLPGFRHRSAIGTGHNRVEIALRELDVELGDELPTAEVVALDPLPHLGGDLERSPPRCGSGSRATTSAVGSSSPSSTSSSRSAISTRLCPVPMADRRPNPGRCCWSADPTRISTGFSSRWPGSMHMLTSTWRLRCSPPAETWAAHSVRTSEPTTT